MPMNHRHITFVHAPFSKGQTQHPLRVGVSGHQHQSRGGHVQSMDHQRVRVKLLDARAQTILLVFTTTGNGQQTGWFVDHQQIGIKVVKLQGSCHGRCACPALRCSRSMKR